MAEKLEQEAEEEEKLYEKFECYCKKTTAALQDAIAKYSAAGPITPEDIAVKQEELRQKREEVKKMKADKAEDEESLKSAKANREREHGDHEKHIAEDKKTESAAEEALSVLSKASPAEPAFLQEGSSKSESGLGFLPALLRGFDRSKRTESVLRKKVVASFLQGQLNSQSQDESGEESAGVDDVKVYIDDLENDAEKEIKEEQKEESDELVGYKEVKKTKAEEISALLAMMERKMKRIAQLQVEIVNMKHQMKDGAEDFEQNQKTLAQVQKNCADRSADQDARKKMRNEEQLALADTIKMLSSDDALDTFKKTLPSGPAPSFLQLSGHSSARAERRKRRTRALVNDALRSAKRRGTGHAAYLNFISLALGSGSKASQSQNAPGAFKPIFKKIDEMVELMDKEQKDDETKKDYCEAQFQKAEKQSKAVEQELDTLMHDLELGKQNVARFGEEIATLRSSIKELDKDIAEASQNREKENVEFQELVTSNTAAIDLLKMAATRLNKFYNPSLVPAAFVQTSAEEEVAAPVEVADAPEAPGGSYQAQGQASNGVLAMISSLEQELQKEITVAKTEEQHAQKDYEETVQDAQQTRAANLNSIETKAQAKSDLEQDVAADQETRKAKRQEKMAAAKLASDLHGECDWLLQNFDLRKQARKDEQASLQNAKATLAGADFS
eukprot:TRINITY_DN2900_c0_g3_i1.p1 TRINITY_DN2900_c0_g3~~TRINITY_DN2900_c0_g3_i1.p1  ORF type:complete len:749 (+),score=237.63 TRINITY_DN2900_c0_g3_i1:226-2247(+)